MDAEKPKNDGTFELASISNRFFALIIDNIILGIVSGIIGGISGRGDAGFLTYFILQTAYQWYFLLYKDGQTPGKSVMHIRVVKADGSRLSGADAVMRSIGYLVNNILFGIGWLWALFDSNYQGLHDKLAKTYVVTA